MEEVIAKSKAFKAAKQKQKEEDEKALEALDADYSQLLASRQLSGLLKPPGFDKCVCCCGCGCGCGWTRVALFAKQRNMFTVLLLGLGAVSAWVQSL